MAKSYCVALICLLIGGLFGLHHFYLGRKRHAVVYLFTMGGFGVGVLNDLLNLGRYVRWANFDHEFKEEYVTMIRSEPEPSLTAARGIAIALIPQMFGNLLHYAIPADLLPEWITLVLVAIIVPLGVAFGVYFIGCIGEIEGSLYEAVKGAVLTIPLYYFNPNCEIYTSLVSCYFFRKSIRYRTKPEEEGSFLYKLAYIGFYFTIVTLLITSMICFNCQVESDGETVKCRDALRHFFTSPLWQDIVSSLQEIKKAVSEEGFGKLFSTLVALMDPTGETNAAKILGVSKDATEDVIKKAYRSLSRQYHPDKNKGKSEEEQKESERMFLQVQEAFNILSKRQKDRIIARQTDRENP